MKKLIAAMCLSLTVSACVSVPDISTDADIVVGGDNLGSAKPARMPDLPASLKTRRGQLPPLTDTSPRGQQLDAINTDIAYNAAAFQVNSLISLWECVMVRINDNKDSSECIKE